MSEELIEFTVSGSPRDVSAAIEQLAIGSGSLHAIVVPWESDNVTLSMAVTSARIDGWAFAPRDPDHADKKRLVTLFESFARQLQTKLQATA